MFLEWMLNHFVGGKSTLARVMAWCGQETNHHQNQCWPRSPVCHNMLPKRGQTRFTVIFTPTTTPPPCIYASMNWISIGSGDGLSPTYSATSHYMNQYWLIVNWTFRNNLPSEIRIKIHDFSFMKIHMKISSVKWRPFCPGGDEVTMFDFGCDSRADD